MTDNLMLSLELESQHQLVLDLEEFELVQLVSRTCSSLQQTSTDHTIVFESQLMRVQSRQTGRRSVRSSSTWWATP